MSAGKKPGDAEALTLSQDPLQLRSSREGVAFQLRLRQQFHLERESRPGWRVTTDAYSYRLDDGTGQELASWHWHPATGNHHPHLHVAAEPISGAHLPTGRVSIESVLRLLLTDLKVLPARDHADDFLKVLEASELPFIEHRRWHAWSRR